MGSTTNHYLGQFRSYLNDRRQLVSTGDIESPTACVPHGVPQGSILGLLLSIAFNDLPLHVSSAQVALYADDTTLTSAANYESIDVFQSSLTTAISEVDQWATAKKSRQKCLPLLVSDFQPESIMILLLLLTESNFKMSNVQSFWD